MIWILVLMTDQGTHWLLSSNTFTYVCSPKNYFRIQKLMFWISPNGWIHLAEKCYITYRQQPRDETDTCQKKEGNHTVSPVFHIHRSDIQDSGPSGLVAHVYCLDILLLVKFTWEAAVTVSWQNNNSQLKTMWGNLAGRIGATDLNGTLQKIGNAVGMFTKSGYVNCVLSFLSFWIPDLVL